MARTGNKRRIYEEQPEKSDKIGKSRKLVRKQARAAKKSKKV